jgi:alpha-D-xyloside xylohydrolase
MRFLKIAACAALLVACAREPEGTYVQDGATVTVTAASGKRVRLEVRTDRIVRVTSLTSGEFDLPKSLMVVDSKNEPPQFEARRNGDRVEFDTGTIRARVSLADGTVAFTDKSGKALLAEEAGVAPAQGVSQRFNAGTDEGLFGSGQHQNAQLDLNGEDVELAQHNMDIAVPFVVSTRNYGVLWDNNGITRIGDPKPYGLVSRDLKVLDASGKEGGFTATYTAGEKKLERVEKDINYQYIRDRFSWPKEMLTGQEPVAGAPPNILPNQAVTWEGSLVSEKASSSSTAAATSRCGSTGSWCWTAGGRTGPPGITTSTRRCWRARRSR